MNWIILTNHSVLYGIYLATIYHTHLHENVGSNIYHHIEYLGNLQKSSNLFEKHRGCVLVVNAQWCGICPVSRSLLMHSSYRNKPGRSVGTRQFREVCLVQLLTWTQCQRFDGSIHSFLMLWKMYGGYGHFHKLISWYGLAISLIYNVHMLLYSWANCESSRF